jgi:hypothetical protein
MYHHRPVVLVRAASLRDIYEAAEQLTAAMAMSVDHLAKQRGWASRTLSGMLVEPRLMMLYSSSVLLPYGRGASFVPARAPRTGDSWMIDIRRSDGVSRPEWNGGIAIRRVGGNYAMLAGSDQLDETVLDRMLEAIGTP